MAKAASIVFAEAAVGIFGGVLFSKAGAAETTVMKSAKAENFMVFASLLNEPWEYCSFELLNECQLEESKTQRE